MFNPVHCVGIGWKQKALIFAEFEISFHQVF